MKVNILQYNIAWCILSLKLGSRVFDHSFIAPTLKVSHINKEFDNFPSTLEQELMSLFQVPILTTFYDFGP